MKQRTKFPWEILSNKNLSRESLVLACYIAFSIHTGNRSVHLNFEDALINIYGAEDVFGGTMRMTQRDKFKQAFAELQMAGYLQYERVQRYFLEYMISLEDIFSLLPNHSPAYGTGAADWDKVTRILRWDDKNVRPEILLKGYLWTTWNYFDHPELPQNLKNKFWCAPAQSLAKFCGAENYLPHACISRGTKILRKLQDLKIVVRHNLDKPVIWHEDGVMRRINIVYMIPEATEEDLESFVNWLRMTYVPLKIEPLGFDRDKKRPPIKRFEYRDELYQGFPARLLKDYRGEDPEFIALRDRMIEEWTQ